MSIPGMYFFSFFHSQLLTISQDYVKGYSILVGRFMEKLDRMDVIYTDEEYLPAAFTKCLKDLRRCLEDVRDKFGPNVMPPEKVRRSAK